MCLSSLALSAQNYYVGGDISLLPKYETNRQYYYDQQGTRITDVLAYMKSDAVGWNAQRVRLFVDPSQASSDDQAEGVCQDLDYVTTFGKRIKDSGYTWMLDFHYSDSWADPAKQTKPSAWSALSTTQLTEKMYTYTKACLEHLVANGATPDMIQVGNEISYGMLWPEAKVYASSNSNWSTFLGYLKSGIKACREVCPKAKIIIHTERAGNTSYTSQYYKKLIDNGLDFDIIGLSYYPFWHNGLSTLSTTLTTCASSFPSKEVMIVETAYYYQWQPSSVQYNFSSTWPITAAGQAQFATDLIAELRKHDNVTGLFWWFPEENGNGNGTLKSWVNRGLWDDNNHKALPALYVLKQFTDGRANGITAVEASATRGECYDLQGRKVSKTYEGIVIQDGKKRIQTAR